MELKLEHPEIMDDHGHRLAASLSAPTVSLMNDINPDERREHNRRVMNDLRASFGLPQTS